MSQVFDIEPFGIRVDDDRTLFAFSLRSSNVLEIPPAFESELRDVVETNRSTFEGKPVHVDLEDTPALSSRQLGLILTIREVMKPFGKLELHNMSASVKQLLQLTGTDRFFDDAH